MKQTNSPNKVHHNPKTVVTPFQHIGHTTPLWPAIPLTSTQHDGSVCILKHYMKNTIEIKSYITCYQYHLKRTKMAIQQRHSPQMVNPLLGLSMDHKCLTHPKSLNFLIWKSCGVTIIRNMVSNKTFPHYVTSLYSKIMTQAYTYSHVAQINTLITFALADMTKSCMQLPKHLQPIPQRDTSHLLM